MPDNKEPFNPEEPVVVALRGSAVPVSHGHLAEDRGEAEVHGAGFDQRGPHRGRSTSTSCRPTSSIRYMLEEKRGKPTEQQATSLAAWIRGDAPQQRRRRRTKADDKEKTEREGKPTTARRTSTGTAAPPSRRAINVIYVGDIDVLSSEFVRMRNEPNMLMAKFRFDNVPFVLQRDRRGGGRESLPGNPQAQAAAQHAADGRDAGGRRPRRGAERDRRSRRRNTTTR